MDTIRRLPASDGAEWLLGGFTLLRRAPVALGALGALWGLLASVVVTVGLAVPALATILQLLVALAGPVLFAGLLWAVREVAHDRPPHPAHLLQGVHEGRVPQLLATLLPQVAAGLLLGVLLLVLVGPQELQHLAQVSQELNTLAQSGQQATPEQVEALVAGLPAGRILLWLLLGLAAAVAVALTVFVSVPRILFDRRDGLQAMGDSLRACVHNLPALAVFLLLTLVAMFAIYFGVLLVTLVVQLVAGPFVAMWVAQLLLMAVLMPLLAGAVYTAWIRLFGEEAPAGTATSGQLAA
ncbi:hypothetical protein MNQ95_07155 [Pseudoxanthomonas daejeonensis]|uniref:Transmembrane protein n=1 Tax=Pseudoxanthomonas daejeonensis TaxID=266062 RepID=A0ABQ6Z6U4_9GAMM|nr:BPSS1780 family membrane protein [Pseudoxanthomonas daejeonensis]KAF1694388.1 hypothetical protein CSC65_09385 [Pseudoxanthomonas daejeonensis]UNK58852.1 hypothetical protein MNQ95_07155 [Pseudoxanthomonas daejeonensis]